MFEIDPDDVPEGFGLPKITAEDVFRSLGGPIYGVTETPQLSAKGPSFSGVDSVTVSYVLDGNAAHHTDLEVLTEFAEDFGPSDSGVPSYIDGRMESFISNYAQGEKFMTTPVDVETDSIAVDGAVHPIIRVQMGEFWAVGAHVADRYIIALGHESVVVEEFLTIYRS